MSAAVLASGRSSFKLMPGQRERQESSYHEPDGDRNEHLSSGQQRSGWLSKDEITRKLAEGGPKVRRIEADHDRYEVYATDGSGARVKVYVNPVSGEVIRREGRS
jgi:hypothetical protein